MADRRRKIEIFSAGCSICEDVIAKVREAACSSCDIQVLDMKSQNVQRRASQIGVNSIPAIVIDGALADCCADRGVDLQVLRTAGLGRPI